MALHPAELFVTSPFHRWLDCEISRMDEGGVVLELPFREEFVGDPEGRTYHGGVIASLVDAAGTFCAIAATGHDCVTVDWRLDFLRPAGPATLTARAESVRVGMRIAVADVEVLDQNGTRVAVGRLTLAVVR